MRLLAGNVELCPTVVSTRVLIVSLDARVQRGEVLLPLKCALVADFMPTTTPHTCRPGSAVVHSSVVLGRALDTVGATEDGSPRSNTATCSSTALATTSRSVSLCVFSNEPMSLASAFWPPLTFVPGLQCRRYDWGLLASSLQMIAMGAVFYSQVSPVPLETRSSCRPTMLSLLSP